MYGWRNTRLYELILLVTEILHDLRALGLRNKCRMMYIQDLYIKRPGEWGPGVALAAWGILLSESPEALHAGALLRRMRSTKRASALPIDTSDASAWCSCGGCGRQLQRNGKTNEAANLAICTTPSMSSMNTGYCTQPVRMYVAREGTGLGSCSILLAS